MKNIRKIVIGIIILHIFLSGVSSSNVFANNKTNNDKLSLSLNKVEPARKELILQKEGNQNVARTSLNFELFREGMLLENPRKPLDVVFVFDKSGSMDFAIDSNTTRLDRAKEAMQTAATVFGAANADRVNKDRFGLVLFNHQVETKLFNKQELTSDVNQISNVIQSVTAINGTNYSASLEEAQRILNNNADANREQVIIFLTDGEPTVLNAKEFPRGKYERLESYTYTCSGRTCTGTRYVDYNYNNFKGIKLSSTLSFTENANGLSIISPSAFTFQNQQFRIPQHARVYIQNHAEDTATAVKNDNILLYPVGFGGASKTYLDKLASKTSNNTSMARTATGSNLNEIFEALIKEIDTPSLSNVSLEIKIPAGVTVEESPGVKIETRSGTKYAIITPENGRVDYEVGVAPGLVSLPNLPLKFTSKGDYRFYAELKYKDMSGKNSGMTYNKEIKVSVSEQVNIIQPSIDFEMEFTTDAQVSENTVRLQKSNINAEDKHSMKLVYTLKPYGKLTTGSKGNLNNIQLKQRIPAGLQAEISGGMKATPLSDGSTEVSIPISAISYESRNNTLNFSKATEKVELVVKGNHSLRSQPLPNPVLEFKDSLRPSSNLTGTITKRFSELIEVVIKLTDLNVQPQIEYRGNHAGNISKYVKHSGQLLATTTLNDANGNQVISPIQNMEFGEGNDSINVNYANQGSNTLYLMPKVSVKSKGDNQPVTKGQNGEYEIDQEALVKFDAIVPGGLTQYEVRTKAPNRSAYTNWNVVNPFDYFTEIVDHGITKVDIKASGGFIRLPYTEELIINYKGITDFSLQYEEEMYVGEKQQIETVLYSPILIPNLSFNWVSSDQQLATVDKNGVVYAQKSGNVIITSNPIGYPLNALATIKIIDFPTYSLAFKKPYYSTKISNTLDLGDQVTMVPEHLNGRKEINVTWESSDSSVFTIDQNGKGIGISSGAVVITATSKEDSSLQATAIVIVGSNGDGGEELGNDYRW